MKIRGKREIWEGDATTWQRDVLNRLIRCNSKNDEGRIAIEDLQKFLETTANGG